MTADPDWMGVDEFASLFSVSTDAAYREIRKTGMVAGEFPAVRIGNTIRLPRKRIEQRRAEMLAVAS